MIRQLATLNAIADTLNRAVDMRSALQDALARLIALMGLETGWIFLADPAATGIRWGKGYTLVAHHNLPPALDLSNPEAWHTNCECQGLCDRGELTGSYNEVTCSRLASVTGDRHGLGVHASTPLYAGDRILGILNVAATGWDRFTPEALALLTNVGRQMGIALDRARLFDMLQDQRIHEQAALLTFSNQLLGRHNLDDLMDYLVQAACVLLDADACALLLPASGGEMVFRAAHGWRGDPVADGRRVPAVGSLPVQVMRTQQPVIVPDVLEVDPDLMLPDWLSEEAFRGHAVVPLIANQRTAGVMLLNTREPRPDDDGATRFLQLLANQAAIALETARLHAEERERWRLADQLAVARRIQLTLLPIACPAVPGWEFQAVYQAAQQVGGDFYDFFALPGEPGRWGHGDRGCGGQGRPGGAVHGPQPDRDPHDGVQRAGRGGSAHARQRSDSERHVERPVPERVLRHSGHEHRRADVCQRGAQPPDVVGQRGGPGPGDHHAGHCAGPVPGDHDRAGDDHTGGGRSGDLLHGRADRGHDRSP
jgi:GAF domain-containing protein